MLIASEPWYTAPAAGYYIPLSDGTSYQMDTSVTGSKARLHQFAGMSNMLVEGGTWRAGNLNWGTNTTTDSPLDTAVVGTSNNIESGTGGNAHIKYVQNADGSQSYAMGRVVKHADGRLVMTQYADDKLFSSHPRTQLFGMYLLSLSGFWRQYVSVQFGDDEIPWPAYGDNVGVDGVLFYQLKGTVAGNPVLQLTAKNNASDRSKIDVQFNVNLTSGGIVSNAYTQSALLPGIRHDFVIDTFLDWRTRGANGGKSYNALWYNGPGETPTLVYSNTSNNTLWSNTADKVQPMWGIYRYQWNTKATDDCRVIFHRAGIKNASRSLAARAIQARNART